MKTLLGMLVLFATFNVSDVWGQASETLSPTENTGRVTSSDAQAFELPSPIVQRLEIAASEGACESSWRDLAADRIVRDDVGDGMTLYLVPCAHWAHNVAWAAFVTQVEPSAPDGYLTLPIRFIDFGYAGLVASDVIHNIVWDSTERTLYSRYYLNGKEECGSAGAYVWNPAQRSLVLQSLIAKDSCESPEPWSLVYSNPK